jgi:hypothetical protein
VPRGRALAADAAVLALMVLAQTAWFAGRPRGLPAWLPLAAAIGLAAWRFGLPRRWPRPQPETLACLGLAVAYRLSALVHPWGWVNRDGAYGAFVALHLLEGIRPAPAFTEGANYQGTLKAHLAALLSRLTGAGDLSFLMVLASTVLYLVFMAATMAVARRLAGRPGAVFAGLYLAVAPKFLHVFSLNCVGQYVEVLALGGVAMALLVRLLQEAPGPDPAAHERPIAAGMGLLLGAAFWQQPVALSYVAVAVLALALRRASWRSGAVLWLFAGLAAGALPVLLWNLQNDWASGDILGREPSELRAQAEAVPRLLRRTLAISFPILAGLAPGHPWSESTVARLLALALFPALLLAFVALRGRRVVDALRQGRLDPALVPLLVWLACVGLFWAVASGKVYWRPRYLLPILAAVAVQLGAVLAWLWSRGRAVAAAAVGGLLLLNAVGTWDRLTDAGDAAAFWRRVVASLDQKGIRTGYADFSIAAPVTMFTAERIVLSPRLGPTPAYESPIHARRLEEAGPDALVLRLDEDPAPMAAVLQGLGVSYRLDLDPVPVFHGLSRRVRVEEVAGYQAGAPPPAEDVED